MEDRYFKLILSNSFKKIRNVRGIKSFFRNKNGSVSVEFIFMLVLLVFIFAFLADLVILRSTLGRLDNASYSSVNILRERTQLYNRTSGVRSQDLTELTELATKMMYGENSKEKVSVILEYWDATQGVRTVSSSNSDCKPYRNLGDLTYLSPHSEINNERRIPLYQVTLCVKTHSFFKALLVNDRNSTEGLLRSSSMSVSR